MRKIFLFLSLYFVLFSTVSAFDTTIISPFDLNNNNLLDKNEVEVVLNSNVTLPAGEYFFNNLRITNNAILTTEGNPTSIDSFKGVKINAVNITVDEGSSISADGTGYGFNSGPGISSSYLYWSGASYGGVGYGNFSTSTYGSAVMPIDLGSGGNGYNPFGGGAIRLIVTDTLLNNGIISANGGYTASGGSIYVTTNNLSGSGSFSANGGNNYCPNYCFGYGGGGRIAIYFTNSSFTGEAVASSGYYCWYGCQRFGGDGTVGFFDTTNNTLIISSFWRFQKNDIPFSFKHIILKNGARVEIEDGVVVNSDDLFISNNSSFTLTKDSVLNIPKITLDSQSTLTLSGKETINTDDIILNKNSKITILPENILSLKIKNLTVSLDSHISADSKGFGYGSGPGAPLQSSYYSGASYGGVGMNNTTLSTYGSETEPIDLGSGGNGYNPFGGGAIRLIVTDTLLNNGIISANGNNTSSGGSIYVTTNNLSGSGSFSANGGGAYCPNYCFGTGGGGRIALYYTTSTFIGMTTVKGGCYSFDSWTMVCAGDGTIVSKKIDPEPYGYSNVLFIPGLEASRLYQGTVPNCQINCEDQLWEPNGNSDVEDLYLNEDGTSKYGFIYTRDIIKETNTPTPMGLAGQNIYKSFSNMMDDLTHGTSPDKMARWESYPYDWRQGVEDIINNGTQYEKGKKSLITILENLVASSTTGRVTIVAHSNGGLIAKALMVKLQEMKNAGTNNLIDKIDNIILVAVPQIGTASAVPAMLHGYDQEKLGGWIMDEKRARELGRNMESAYGLLPSKEYINRVSASPINFVSDDNNSEVTKIFIDSYGNVIDSYAEYISFILGNEGRIQPTISNKLLPIKLSSTLFSKAEDLHNKIDTWVLPEGIRVIEIAGWGLDTVASFEYYPKYECAPSEFGGVIQCGYILDERPRFTIDGDKTVVVPSAQYMINNAVEKYWVDIDRQNGQILGGFRRNREHKDILEIDSLNNMIKSVIQKTDIVFDTVLKNTEPIDSKNRFRLSVHSPVTLGAYDSLGNFTGKVCPTGYDFCYIRDEIPNSSYLEFGEGKYLNLPEENMEKVVLEGIDIGTFTYESEKVIPGSAPIVTRFVDIPVTPQTTIEISTNPVNQNIDMKIDTNSDGVTDITIKPNDVFDPITYLQVMRKTVENLDVIKTRRTGFLNRIDATIKAIQKGKINKAKLKIEKFENVLEKIINRKDSKKMKPHRITKAEAEQLLLMLDTLLNNLNK